MAPYAPAAGTHSCYRLSRNQGLVRLKGFGKLKIPKASSGIEAVSFLLVVLHTYIHKYIHMHIKVKVG
jgi:hypothetical protein